MRHFLFIIVTLALTCAQAANATVTLGFEINSIDERPLFEYNTHGTPTVTDDTLNADNAVTFTVKVNGADVLDVSNANFTFDADLVNYINTGFSVVLQFSGSFTITTAANELVLTATFTDASTLMFGNGLNNTNLVASVSDIPSIYVAGPALQPFLPSNTILGPAQTMNFTIELLQAWAGEEVNGQPVGTGLPHFTGADFQSGEVDSNYVFDSSFSGTSELAEVPEPATLGILLAGILFMGQRSRRQA